MYKNAKLEIEYKVAASKCYLSTLHHSVEGSSIGLAEADGKSRAKQPAYVIGEQWPRDLYEASASLSVKTSNLSPEKRKTKHVMTVAWLC